MYVAINIAKILKGDYLAANRQHGNTENENLLQPHFTIHYNEDSIY